MSENNTAPSTANRITVLLVDDSLISVTILKRILGMDPAIEVVGTARNGEEALRLIPQLDPKVVCTDLHMPVMDGLRLTQEIMARYPRPILVVSVSVERNSGNVFHLLEAGALDVFQKPRSGAEDEYIHTARELIGKIRVLSGVHVFKRAKRLQHAPPGHFPQMNGKMQRIVAIGASTGGPQALYTILSRVPADYRYPIVCVQHISEGFLGGMIEWLRGACALNIKIALEGEPVRPGYVYFPAEGVHLEITEQGRFHYSNEFSEEGHTPSISVMFRSLAGYCGGMAVGVLLTGMGSDGAAGMRSIADAGGLTIAQDEMTSVVYGMPKKAIEMKAAGKVLPLEEIAETIAQGTFQ